MPIFIKHEIISFANFFLISLCYYIFMGFAENLRNELTYNDIKIKELSARTNELYKLLDEIYIQLKSIIALFPKHEFMNAKIFQKDGK